jgi:hypothetical protein
MLMMMMMMMMMIRKVNGCLERPGTCTRVFYCAVISLFGLNAFKSVVLWRVMTGIWKEDSTCKGPIVLELDNSMSRLLFFRLYFAGWLRQYAWIFIISKS